MRAIVIATCMHCIHTCSSEGIQLYEGVRNSNVKPNANDRANSEQPAQGTKHNNELMSTEGSNAMLDNSEGTTAANLGFELAPTAVDPTATEGAETWTTLLALRPQQPPRLSFSWSRSAVNFAPL